MMFISDDFLKLTSSEEGFWKKMMGVRRSREELQGQQKLWNNLERSGEAIVQSRINCNQVHNRDDGDERGNVCERDIDIKGKGHGQITGVQNEVLQENIENQMGAKDYE